MEKKTVKFHVLAIICIILFCVSLSPITMQNDTYYTIKIGEHILGNGIDMQDTFSWHEDLPYTYPHWAYDVATYLVYKVGGFLGIYIATAVLACILGIAIYFVNYKRAKNPVVSFIITLAAMYLLKDFIAARAQLVTFILFILTIYFIEQFLDTKKKRYAVGLIIIPIIIANVHLAVWPFYFVLFMPYIGEYIIALLSNSIQGLRKIKLKRMKSKISDTDQTEEAKQKREKIEKLEQKIEQINERKQKLKEKAYKLEIVHNPNVKYLILIMIICLFTGLLTPLGDTPYTYLIKTMQGNTTGHINEHLPLTLINNIEFMAVIIVFLAILIFTDTKLRLSDLFMIGGLILLAFKSRRQVSMFVLICSVMLNRLVCKLIDKYDPEGTEKFIKFIVTFLGKILAVSVILLLCLLTVRKKVGDEFVDKSSYPVDAAQYIKENIDISTMKLYNEYNYGSYLLFQDIPVFIDSRADLYTPEFNGGKDVFSDFLNIANIGEYYEDKMTEYGITHVLMSKNAKLNMFISRDENYKEIYVDDYFCIYERNTNKR